MVAQSANSNLTRYTQVLVSPLSQVLQTSQGSAVNNYVYGNARLYGLDSSNTRTWYVTDALGSVHRTLADNGTPSAPIVYDAFGTPQSGEVPTFGFTGELYDAGLNNIYLRARWYTPGSGSFISRDPFSGYDQQPYSLHPYQYGYANPALYSDPSGKHPDSITPEEGMVIHGMIQLHFLAYMASIGQTGAVEDPTERPDLGKWGSADLVNKDLKEIYEIKPHTVPVEVAKEQAESYIRGKERGYSYVQGWHLGTTYLAGGKEIIGPWPIIAGSSYNSNKPYVVVAKLAADGVIHYHGERVNQKQRREAEELGHYDIPAILELIKKGQGRHYEKNYPNGFPQIKPYPQIAYDEECFASSGRGAGVAKYAGYDCEPDPLGPNGNLGSRLLLAPLCPWPSLAPLLGVLPWLSPSLEPALEPVLQP